MTDRRWYVAWCPGWPQGVVRAKSPEELQAWREREWEMFPRAPIIADVTAAMGALLATLSAPAEWKLEPPPRDLWTAVLTLSEAGPDIALRSRKDPPLPDEVADLGFDLSLVLNDVVEAWPALLPTFGVRKRRQVANKPVPRYRAAAPFPAHAHVFMDAHGHLWPVGTPIEPRHCVPNGGRFQGAPALRWPSYVALDAAVTVGVRVAVEPYAVTPSE